MVNYVVETHWTLIYKPFSTRYALEQLFDDRVRTILPMSRWVEPLLSNRHISVV